MLMNYEEFNQPGVRRFKMLGKTLKPRAIHFRHVLEQLFDIHALQEKLSWSPFKLLNIYFCIQLRTPIDANHSHFFREEVLHILRSPISKLRQNMMLRKSQQ